MSGQVQGLACFRCAVMKEDALNDHLLLPLHAIRGLRLVREQFLELRRQVEDAAFQILRCSGIQPNFASLEIDLSPLQRQDLTVDTPARDKGEGHHWTPVLGNRWFRPRGSKTELSGELKRDCQDNTRAPGRGRSEHHVARAHNRDHWPVPETVPELGRIAVTGHPT